jgi:hypothetical protein
MTEEKLAGQLNYHIAASAGTLFPRKWRFHPMRRYIVILQRTLEAIVEVDAPDETAAMAEAQAHLSEEWPSWMIRPAPRTSAPHIQNQTDGGWKAVKADQM